MNDTRTLPLHARLVKIDETRHWNLSEWPEVKAIYSIWLYDENDVTYLCEITPSYCLHPIETYPEFYEPEFYESEKDDRRREEIMDDIRENAYIDGWNVMYVHCRDTDGLPGHDFGEESISFDDVAYDEQIEAMIEHCQCNQFL